MHPLDRNPTELLTLKQKKETLKLTTPYSNLESQFRTDIGVGTNVRTLDEF